MSQWAREKPEETAFVFLERGETPAAQLTFGGLQASALFIAGSLQDAGLAGKPVLVVYPSCLDFIQAFVGCLFSGAIAVPAPFPQFDQAKKRIVAIALASGATAVLARSEDCLNQKFRDLFDGTYVAEFLSLPSTFEARVIPNEPHSVSPQQPAFLQFTSGSTSQPKGVLVNHGNLSANMEMIREAFNHDGSTRFVSWLPMFHDMGLVGCILQPLWLGIPCYLMTPYAFLQKPIRWLRAVADYRATTSGAPNFAYELAARLIHSSQCEDLDLSSWKVAFCGAEPVRADTLSRFAHRFSQFKLDPLSLLPCYGMAEATLFISGGPAGKGMRTKNGHGQQVRCGQTWGNTDIAIVDPLKLAPVSEGEVGEIWITGDQVAVGYWGDPELTAQSFHKQLNGRTYLRTGDLGHREQGDLIITGRLKDIVIIHGVNYAAEELEKTVCESDPLLSGSMMAIFNADDKVVALIEFRTSSKEQQDLGTLAERLVIAVLKRHGIRLNVTALMRYGCLPRTTSGKIRRNDSREAFLSGGLAPLTLYRKNA